MALPSPSVKRFADEDDAVRFGGLHEVEGGEAERLRFNAAWPLSDIGRSAGSVNVGRTVDIWFMSAVAAGATAGRPLPSKGTPERSGAGIGTGDLLGALAALDDTLLLLLTGGGRELEDPGPWCHDRRVRLGGGARRMQL